MEITDSGTKHLNTLLIKVYKKLAAEAGRIAKSESLNEIDQICIENAVQSFLSGDLAKYAIREGGKAVGKFNGSSGGEKTARAGLVVNVDVVYRLLCNGKYANSISENAAVYLAAVIEYLTLEILELSGNEARNRKSVNIIPDFINVSINIDEELRELISRSNE